jgi:hypothetical protein
VGMGGQPMSDTGDFRIANLVPGRYFLLARPMGINAGNTANAKTAYTATFLPGVTKVENASPITVTTGQEMSNLNLQMQKVNIYTVRGKIGFPWAAGMNVEATPVQDNEAAGAVMFVMNVNGDRGNVRDDGTFEVHGVEPGPIQLRVSSRRGPMPGGSAGRLRIEMPDRDLENVIIPASSLVTVEANVKWEGSAEHSAAGQSLIVIPTAGGQATRMFGMPTPVDDKGHFKQSDLDQGKYTIIPMGGDTYVKRISIGGQVAAEEVMDLSEAQGPVQVDVVLSDRMGSVSGTVQLTDAKQEIIRLAKEQAAAAGNGQAPDIPPVGFVVLISEDRPNNSPFSMGRSQELAIQADGSFGPGNLRPGKYRAFAFEEYDRMDGLDPEDAKRLSSRSVVVDLKEDQSATISVKQITQAERKGQ